MTVMRLSHFTTDPEGRFPCSGGVLQYAVHCNDNAGRYGTSCIDWSQVFVQARSGVTRLCTCSVLLVFALGGPGFKCYEANQTITFLHLCRQQHRKPWRSCAGRGTKGVASDVCLLTCARDIFCYCCCPEQSLTIDALVHFRLRNRLLCGETCLCIAVVES